MKIDGVTESVINCLREQIITGDLPAGVKLNEIEMAARMEISRPPLREAFRKLEYEKLVQSIPRKGTYVSTISFQDCEHLFHVRKILECAALDCIKKQKLEKFDLIEKSLQVTQGINASFPPKPDSQQVIQYYEIMATFHYKILELSKNKWLIHCYNSLRSSLARYQIIYLHLPGSYQVSVADHVQVLELIKGNKFAAAKEHLCNHIDRTLNKLKQRMING